MTMRREPDKALAAKVQPGGAAPRQDCVLAGPPPRARRPPGRPEARKRGGVSSGRFPGPQAPPGGRDEGVGGRREPWMRLLPEGISDLDPNLRWIVGESLRLMEEVVCGLQTSGAGAPGMEEADAAAIVDDMRSEVRKWWQEFTERQLLTELYQRTARRREGRGSPNSRRPHVSSGGPPGCPGPAGRHSGNGPVGRRARVRSGFGTPGRPMGVSQRQTPPNRVARVHRAVGVQPELLRRSRAHRGEA